MTREAAVAQLEALGASVVTVHGDVAELRRAIRTRDAHRQPMQFNPRRQCIGKMQHWSFDEARKASRRMSKPDVEAYRCPHCSAFHVGHVPKGSGR